MKPGSGKKFVIRSIRELPPAYQGASRPSVVIAGRSNCGKSTLINALLGRKIAATSKSPGRTRKVHRFLINDRFDLVDLPGYGYAKVGEDLRLSWREKVTRFLSGHGNIRRLLLLVDIRRECSDLDLEMLQWADLEEVPVSIVLTKADKLSRQNRLNAIRKLKEQFPEGTDIHTVSALKKNGIQPLLERMVAWWSEDAFRPESS